MAKLTSTFICQQCGFRSSQFLGKCPECGTWNSLVETVEEAVNGQSGVSRQRKEGVKIINLKDVEQIHLERLSTNLGEFDRVLGGGIVPGSLILVAGDPGIGKSTLLTQLALNIEGREKSVERLPAGKAGIVENQGNMVKQKTIPYTLNAHLCLYVAGEESPQQIKIRVNRISKDHNLAVLNETDVDVIIQTIKELWVEKKTKGVVIIDSIQTLETGDLNSVAGSVGQVRECSHRLQQIAKALHITIFLVGHVTKEGTVAGPKVLEHLVDVVLSLEGETTSNFRILRANKNRFGSTDEVGIFEMTEAGMLEVKNPSAVFLNMENAQIPGSATVVTLTGLRPLLVEIQALVTKSYLPVPMRRGSGIDNNRLQLLVAVVSKRLGLPLMDKDIFVNVTGGLKITEPAIDLGVAMAMVSSLKDLPILPKTVFLGEVGLLGEVRVVRQLEKRVSEAKKLGFTRIVSAKNVKFLSEAARLAFVVR